MKRSLLALVSTALLVLSACTSGGGRYSTLAEPGFSARPGQSWAWQPMRPLPGQISDPRVDNDIVRGALERAIRSAMSARGFVETDDAAAADLLLAYRVGLTRRTEQRETPAPPVLRQRVVCGARGCIPVLDTWAWYGAPVPSVRTVDYLEGGVMLDVFDAKTGRLGWRGTVDDRVQRDGMPPQAKVDEAIARLLGRLRIDE